MTRIWAGIRCNVFIPSEASDPYDRIIVQPYTLCSRDRIPPMQDSAEQLQRLYVAGFELETFERFPKAIGVLRQGYIAFLVPGPDGLQILGNVGRRMGESLGPLVDRGGRKVFVHKQEELEATEEMIADLEQFRSDLRRLLQGEEFNPQI